MSLVVCRRCWLALSLRCGLLDGLIADSKKITQTRGLRTTQHRFDRKESAVEKAQEKRRKAAEVQLFDELSEIARAKDKATFLQALAIYEQRQSVYKRGHVDFILGALEKTKEFGVHKDIEIYKAIMQIFPEGTMVAKNVIQSEFMHFPRQQDAAIQILIAMSNVGCIPDDKMGDIIISRFGKYSYVMKRYQRMMYWMPKFRSMNPYPIPWNLPDQLEELAILALKRMVVDPRNKVTIYYSEELELVQDRTFIASAISPEQQELIRKHKADTPLFVEGGFAVWLREKHLTYFILRADPRPDVVNYNTVPSKYHEEIDRLPTFIGADDEAVRKTAILTEPSRHEQAEGTILAMCITGTSSKDSLLSWIAFLQRETPSLANVPVVFSLRTPESGLQDMSSPNWQKQTNELSRLPDDRQSREA